MPGDANGATTIMSVDEAIVVSLFDYTCNIVAPWSEAGFTCYCVDLRHPPGMTRDGNLIRVGADVREWLPTYAPVRILFAFPPCTDVAVSGARWFKDKGLGALIDALENFDAALRLAEWTKAPYFIENPVSMISSYWRKPDYTFDPCDYGGYFDPPRDAYTKKTCLWTGNGFAMPEPRRVRPKEGSRMHRLAPSEDRATVRSITPTGFARAVFEANAPKLNRATPHLLDDVNSAAT